MGEIGSTCLNESYYALPAILSIQVKQKLVDTARRVGRLQASKNQLPLSQKQNSQKSDKLRPKRKRRLGKIN